MSARRADLRLSLRLLPAGDVRSQPLFLEGHAFEVTALELPAGNFRCLLIETGEARSVKHLVTCLHAFGERVGRSKRGAGLELRFT